MKETFRDGSGTVTGSSAEAAPVLVYALARVTDEDGTSDWLVPVTWFSVDEESLTSCAEQWLNQPRHKPGGGYRTGDVLRVLPGELPTCVARHLM